MTSNSNIDEIDLAITTRIYVDPPGVAGTEINMRAKLTEEAKARVQQELLKAELKGFDKAFDSHDYDGLRKYKANLQAKLKGTNNE